MSDFLLLREKRKRKREIYSRANKALGDLTEALLDMREFSEDIKPLYDHLGENAIFETNSLGTVIRRLKKIDLENDKFKVSALLSLFNNCREEI